MDEANDAFRRAVELDPADQVALSHLGHTSAATGREEEAVGYLSQAAQSMRGASTAAISLVDMYRTLGHYEEALAQARRIAEAEPEDLMAALDVAELSLEVGQLDEAVAAFERLRALDDVPGPRDLPAARDDQGRDQARGLAARAGARARGAGQRSRRAAPSI